MKQSIVVLASEKTNNTNNFPFIPYIHTTKILLLKCSSTLPIFCCFVLLHSLCSNTKLFQMDFFLLILLVLNKKLLLKQCNKAITATTKPTNCFIEAKEEEENKVAQKSKGIIQLIEIKCITLNLKAKKKKISQLKSNDKHKTKASNVTRVIKFRPR